MDEDGYVYVVARGSIHAQIPRWPPAPVMIIVLDAIGPVGAGNMPQPGRGVTVRPGMRRPRRCAAWPQP